MPLEPSTGNQQLQRALAERSDQPTLRVTVPDDEFEREANRVAAAVMGMPNSVSRGDYSPEDAPGGIVQRMCPRCRRRHRQGKPLNCSDCEEKLQRRGASGEAPEVDGDLERQIETVRRGGRPLPASVRSFFEPRFGRDFSDVRVHTGRRADAAARSVHAKAFTVGTDVAFRSGAYQPSTVVGKELLAHELTHVVQQNRESVTDVEPTILPYRPDTSANFGGADGGSWKEKPFGGKDKDPWIEKITVAFDGIKKDDDGDTIPTGKLTATYYDNSHKRSGVSVKVVGGKDSAGYSDQGNHTVKRIEGIGYHHTRVPEAKQIQDHERSYKYFKRAQASFASMNFAVFFTQGKGSGNQAIHYGSLNHGSLACVHVNDDRKMRQINYHSVKGLTTVEIKYASSSLAKLCCARYDHVGYMVPNPCGNQDPSKC